MTDSLKKLFHFTQAMNSPNTTDPQTRESYLPESIEKKKSWVDWDHHQLFEEKTSKLVKTAGTLNKNVPKGLKFQMTWVLWVKSIMGKTIKRKNNY